MSEIIDDENERKKSLIDRISFDTLMYKLECAYQKLISEGREDIVERCFFSKDPCQTIHVVKYDQLQGMIMSVLGEFYRKKLEMRDYLLKMLVKKKKFFFTFF